MANTKEIPVIWFQGAGCTGCSVSVLNSVSPDIRNVLIDEVVPGQHVSLIFHATVMAGSGEPVVKILDTAPKDMKKGYVLVVEGSIPTAENGIHGTVGEREGKEVTILQRVSELSAEAMAVLAVGTCATYGGIPSAEGNLTQAKGVAEVLKEKGIQTPVINLPGCPLHPDWFVGTVAEVILKGIPPQEAFDEVGRPKAFYGKLVHDNCPRRADFEVGRFAEKFGTKGCLFKLGCKGYLTYADCPNRHWNHGENWCIDAGSPCHGCVEPEFPDVGDFYQKVSDDQIVRLVVGEDGKLQSVKGGGK